MNVISVSREFGSGGRELGKRLADALGYKYLDSEIVSLIAKEAGLDEQYVASMMEKPGFHLHFGTTFDVLPQYDNYTKVLIAQQKVLNEIAENYNCVIVGRAASQLITKGRNFSIFVHADTQAKLKRCKARNEKKNTVVSDKELLKMMKKVDDNRRKFYDMYFDIRWGNKENYDMTINTTFVNIKQIVPALAAYINAYFEEQPALENKD